MQLKHVDTNVTVTKWLNICNSCHFWSRHWGPANFTGWYDVWMNAWFVYWPAELLVTSGYDVCCTSNANDGCYCHSQPGCRTSEQGDTSLFTRPIKSMSQNVTLYTSQFVVSSLLAFGNKDFIQAYARITESFKKTHNLLICYSFKTECTITGIRVLKIPERLTLRVKQCNDFPYTRFLFLFF
jgi:hypothetical protein